MKLLPLLILLLMLSSCAGRSGNPFVAGADAPTWPHPPEQPRVRYVMSFSESGDLFDSAGFFTRLIDFVFGSETVRMVRPYAVAIHPDGGIIVSDPGMARVHYFDIPSRRYHELGRDMATGLPSPVGVAVSGDGMILVSDSRLRSIEMFGRDGKHVGRFAGEHEFIRPGGIAVDARTGHVLVADILGHSIAMFQPDGTLVHRMGGNGVLPGLMNFPTHLAVTPEGHLMVADSMNFRIQTIDQRGNPVASYGDPGNARGNFARPKGVACIDSDTHVAIEGLYSALVFFDSDGRLLMTMGESGSEPGQFWLPAGLAMDGKRNLLFVADSYNSRVQVFEVIPRGREIQQPEGGTAP